MVRLEILLIKIVNEAQQDLHSSMVRLEIFYF